MMKQVFDALRSEDKNQFYSFIYHFYKFACFFCMCKQWQDTSVKI